MRLMKATVASLLVVLAIRAMLEVAVLVFLKVYQDEEEVTVED